MDDKFDAHMNEIGIPTVLESSIMQIKSSLILSRVEAQVPDLLVTGTGRVPEFEILPEC